MSTIITDFYEINNSKKIEVSLNYAYNKGGNPKRGGAIDVSDRRIFKADANNNLIRFSAS
jgi:hypothetical protein